MSCENSRCLDSSLVWVKQFTKGHSDNLELSEKLRIPCQVNSEFWVIIFLPVHTFPWHIESCLEDRVESVCFGSWGLPSVKNVFEVTEGKNQTLVGAIPFCGEYPGPRFEDKFRSANQIDGISIADGGKMADS